MSVQKIKHNASTQHKVHKEKNGVERTKILKEINKITSSQLKSLTNVPFQNVLIRKKVSRSKHDEGQKRVKTCRAFKSQSSQTEWVTTSEYEGVVRYPSSRRIEARPMKEVGLQVQQSHEDVKSEVSHETGPSVISHVKVKRTPVIKPRSVPKNKPDPCRAPPTYLKGVVPKYLQKLKHDEVIKVLRPKKTVSAVPIDSDLEREQKMEKLANWHDSYKQMVCELNFLSAVS